MTATTFIHQSTSYLVLVMLLASGAAHMLRPEHLLSSLRQQGVPGALLPRAITVSVIAGELAIGAVGLVGGLQGRIDILQYALLASVFLLLMYGGWISLLLHKGLKVPCGCLGSQEVITGWTSLRALLFGGAALMGALTANQATTSTIGGGGKEEAVVLVVALTIALLLWLLPRAMVVDLAPHRPISRRGSNGNA